MNRFSQLLHWFSCTGSPNPLKFQGSEGTKYNVSNVYDVTAEQVACIISHARGAPTADPSCRM